MSIGEICFVIVLLTVGTLANEHKWSEQTYEDKPYTLSCNNSEEGVFVNTDDKLYWMKIGHAGYLTNDDHFELRARNGIDNFDLYIKNVTEETSGVYICEIYQSDNTYHNRAIRGVNIGGPKYEDLIDKYRTNIITGVVAGAAVFVIIAGVCAIDRFRFLTDEQKQKRRDQKEERLRRLDRHKNGGMDNFGYEVAVDGKKDSQNTHL